MEKDPSPYVAKYRNPWATVEEAVARLSTPDGVPRIILGVGPCRSGTTVSLRVFGTAGITSYWNPLKTAYRHALLEMDQTVGLSASSPLYFKETLGPYTRAESSFNPLDVVLALHARQGHNPAEYTHVVVFGRHPVGTLHSWKKSLAGKEVDDRIAVENLLLTYATTEAVRNQATALGIPLTHYVVEANKHPEHSIRRLFDRLGIENEPVLSGWAELPAYGEEGSNIHIPGRPKVYEVSSRVHERAQSSDRLEFVPDLDALVTDEDWKVLADSPAFETFEAWRRKSSEELEFTLISETPQPPHLLPLSSNQR